MQQSGSAFDSAGADGDFPEAKSSVEGGLQEQEVHSFGSAPQEDQGYQKALNKTSGTIHVSFFSSFSRSTVFFGYTLENSIK